MGRVGWFVAVGAVLFFAATLVGCGALPFISQIIDSQVRSGFFEFDLSGAVAIAGGGAQNRALGRNVSPMLTDETEAALVKVLSDGTIESAIGFDNSGWAPNVAFMVVGDDGSIYVGFEWAYWFWSDGSQHEAQLVRVHRDTNEVDIVWPPAGQTTHDVGFIDTWGMDWMDQDPVVVGPDGNLYFKSTSWLSNTNADHIWKYDPVAGGAPTQVTPQNATLQISTYRVDSRGHLFIHSDGWYSGLAETSYLRYYTDGEEGYQNIYYSSTQDTWVRGYVNSPDGSYIVINGYNIRDMNGIIKVDILGPKEVDYDLLYGNANGGGNWVRLHKHYTDTWINGTELVEMTSGSWEAPSFAWMDDVLNTAGTAIDEAKLLTRVQPYFYGDVTVNGTWLGTVNASIGDLGIDLTSPVGGSTQEAWRWIANAPEQFLAEFFVGDLFSNWLADNGLTDFNFDNIASVMWSQSGELFGLYNPYWWGGVDSQMRVVKLLDETGQRDLQVVGLEHGDEYPSRVKVIGDMIYYRYSILDQDNQESGRHRLARYNIETGVEENLLDMVPELEIIAYDVSDDHGTIYFLGADSQTNSVINGKVDIAAGSWEQIDSTLRLSNIKVIE